MLLTGDLEEAGELAILDRQKERPMDCDVLKVGHHGSDTSTSDAWLQAVRPEIALISCGKENAYGHPHKETLERLRARGSMILATPDCGAITVRSNGEIFTVEGYRKGN